MVDLKVGDKLVPYQKQVDYWDLRRAKDFEVVLIHAGNAYVRCKGSVSNLHYNFASIPREHTSAVSARFGHNDYMRFHITGGVSIKGFAIVSWSEEEGYEVW
tara:strand:- start:4123 stop:4428 length:306 start_codon:yes stop_codon:yes gene_type:complete